MNPSILKILISVCLLSFFYISEAQNKTFSSVDSMDQSYLNWFNLDPAKDKVQGIAVNRAYKEFLKTKTPEKKVVVAVIDGGVDIYHEDLVGKIWMNKKEIRNNGIDDDNNGYIDDIHGWNFIGSSKGENIKYETLEQVRVVRKYSHVFKDKKSIENMPESQKAAYIMYLESKKLYEDELKKYQDRHKAIYSFESRLNNAENVIKNHLKSETYTLEDLKKINSQSQNILNSKNYLLELYKDGYNTQELIDMKERNRVYLDYLLNIEYDPRKSIGDDPEDINDKNYGNNDVKGPRASHGTAVAGVIAANRNNKIGIDGIAENVEIMVLRVVPEGDERDKDVALAIRYAVDNGADIINMSFGKDFSPEKKFVDDAVKYADQYNVLLVHAAGNKSENVDEVLRFPSNHFNDGTSAEKWITVGATSKVLNKNFCGVFSNYGKKNVDLFAPGVNIITLSPENLYGMANGTSFSSPVLSGVAALVWSYYPKLSALELKEILLNSTTNYSKKKVYIPNITTSDKVKTRFSSLSKTGGIVNAYKALILAEKFVNPTEGNKKKK